MTCDLVVSLYPMDSHSSVLTKFSCSLCLFLRQAGPIQTDHSHQIKSSGFGDSAFSSLTLTRRPWPRVSDRAKSREDSSIQPPPMRNTSSTRPRPRGRVVSDLRPLLGSAQPSPPPPHQPAAATMSRGSSNSVFLGVDVGTGSARAGSTSDSLFFDPLFYLPFFFV